jgi:5-methylcytosine-specific restriction protein A
VPSRPLVACPTCGDPLPAGVPCPRHVRARRQAYDQQRPSAAARLYGPRWRRYRETFLAAHPVCVHCHQEGRPGPANEVDHIVPHRGDHALFWDGANHQGLCKHHHSRKTRLEGLPGPRGADPSASG